MKLNRIFTLFFFLILIIQFSSAIRINEAESNPLGDDAGNEWVELYSNQEINLTGYYLKNADNQTINLTGSFTGYFVYIFPTQWLDNSDEKVYLYFEGNIVDETSLFDDSQNSILTWNYCNSNWVFVNSTKGQQNICDSQNNQTNSTTNSTTNTTNYSSYTSITNFTKSNDEISLDSSNYTASQNPDNSPNNYLNRKSVDLAPISLNAQTIKTEENSDFENKTKGKYAVYLLITFCVLLLFLFLLRKKKYTKNEFN